MFSLGSFFMNVTLFPTNERLLVDIWMDWYKYIMRSKGVPSTSLVVSLMAVIRVVTYRRSTRACPIWSSRPTRHQLKALPKVFLPLFAGIGCLLYSMLCRVW